jgi:hypothetical protein
MPKHQVIRDVGRSLAAVLQAEITAAKVKGKVHIAIPSPEFLKKNSPCLVLFLHDVKPWHDVRVGEKWHLEEEVTDEHGETYVVRYGRPLDLTLHYLITASAEDLGEEHELLALGLKALLDNGKLEGEQLLGDSFFRGDGLPIAIDDTWTRESSAAVFGSFGAGPRLAVGYKVEARLQSGKETGRSRRVRERHIDVFDPLRPPPGSVSAKELGLEAKPPKIVASKK